MTNDTYQAFRGWLAKASMEQAYQALKDQVQDDQVLRLVWDQDSPSEWAWLVINIIRAWQAEFQYKCLTPRAELISVTKARELKTSEEPWGLLSISPEASSCQIGDVQLPTEQGQLTVLDSQCEFTLGPGLWALVWLVPTSTWTPPKPEDLPSYQVQQGQGV